MAAMFFTQFHFTQQSFKDLFSQFDQLKICWQLSGVNDEFIFLQNISWYKIDIKVLTNIDTGN